MTKGELRKARKLAKEEGRKLVGDLALEDRGDRGAGAVEFTESRRGRRALERWSRRYDELNGAPEGDGDQ